MVNFTLELEGTFIQNLRAYDSIMKTCYIQKMSFEDSMRTISERFPDFNRLQMLELTYESHELFCIRQHKERNINYDINNPKGLISKMLEARQNEDFYESKFIQVMGRAFRGGSFDSLIGKEMRIKIDNVKRKRNE